MAPIPTISTSAIPATRNFKALCTFLFPLIDPAAALTAAVIGVTSRSSFEGEARDASLEAPEEKGRLG